MCPPYRTAALVTPAPRTINDAGTGYSPYQVPLYYLPSYLTYNIYCSSTAGHSTTPLLGSNTR